MIKDNLGLKTRLLILAFSLAAAPLFSGEKLEYGTYINARYQFEVKYPKEILLPGDPPDNNDGRAFNSKDKKVEMAVQGRHLIDVTWAEDFQECLNQYRDAHITYKSFKKSFFVISGYRGDEIFYVKQIYLGPDDNPIVLQMEFTYPKKDKTVWDSAVVESANSLKPLKIEVPDNSGRFTGLGPNSDQFK